MIEKEENTNTIKRNTRSTRKSIKRNTKRSIKKDTRNTKKDTKPIKTEREEKGIDTITTKERK